MQEDWKRQSAIANAETKLEQAADLIREASQILRACGLNGRACDADEALTYVYGAAGANYD